MTTRTTLTKTEVSFPSCGTELRGWILRPAGEPGPLPAIVITHGVSGTKDGNLYEFGERFAASGFVVLGYDHINFGASGGEPRQQVDAASQRRGYVDAITFMSLRPDVDADRIGLWGTSFSGCHVIQVAAQDPRVRAVVAQVCHLEAHMAPLPEPLRILQEEDRQRRFRGEAPLTIPVVSSDPTEMCLLPGEAAYNYLMTEAVKSPSWKNEVTISSFEINAGTYDAPYLPFISPTPLMLIMAENDELVSTPEVVAAFGNASEPKKLVMVPGNHFAPYQEQFDFATSQAVDWFLTNLVDSASSGELVQRTT